MFKVWTKDDTANFNSDDQINANFKIDLHNTSVINLSVQKKQYVFRELFNITWPRK